MLAVRSSLRALRKLGMVPAMLQGGEPVMSLDDTVNLERLATAFEKIAVALDERNKIEREKLLLMFPTKREPKPAEVIRPDEERKKLLDDRPDADWLRDTEAALPPSRFQERFDASVKSQGRGSQGRSAKAVPKTQ